MSSMMNVSQVGLTLLVTDPSLVWKHILVMRVVWQVAGSDDVSKIYPSGVLDLSVGGLGIRGVVRHRGI